MAASPKGFCPAPFLQEINYPSTGGCTSQIPKIPKTLLKYQSHTRPILSTISFFAWKNIMLSSMPTDRLDLLRWWENFAEA